MLQRLAGYKWLAGGYQHAVVRLLFPGPTFTWLPLSLRGTPNNIALAGSEIYAQSAVIRTSANSAFDGAGAEASNGLKLVLGY